MKKPKRIDWDAIELAYVTGTESQRTLAARFGVVHTELSKRSKSGQWVRKRKEFRAESMANALQKSMRAREEEIIEGLQGGDLVNRRAMQLLNATDFFDFITATKQPCKELEAISKVFMNVEETRRLLRGEMKPAETEKLRLEREKWEHEIRREQEQETGKGHVDVVFEGELDDYAT